MPRKKKLEQEEIKKETNPKSPIVPTKDWSVRARGRSPMADSGGNSYFYAYGSRKEARARVRLYPKSGQIIVNDKPIEEYFPGAVPKTYYLMPFKLTDTLGKYSATIKVEGSGKSGQLGAVIHALSRALISVNPNLRPILKKAKLLTRDPRAKERRKYGLAQKARKGKQSPRR